MRIENLVGERLVVGIPGIELSKEVSSHLRVVNPGSIIVFRRNFISSKQFCSLVDSIKDLLGRDVIFMLDHEGGRVMHISEGATHFPSAFEVGLNGTYEQVMEQGAVEASELKAIGVNVNLAPCVDVLVEGSDLVIGSRSYGSNPRRVCELSCARIRGLQGAKVSACAKHFPGLGAVPKDPHKQLPSVSLGWDDMRTCHLLPFKEAISCGVWAVMSSHVCYPNLAPGTQTPATFSSFFMRDILRRELGFEGVSLTDDLEMGALNEICSIEESAKRAVLAGHDLLLICSDASLQRKTFDFLCRAYRNGEFDKKDFDESISRIRAFKGKLGLGSLP